jgi:hypothetical protein
MSSLLPSADNPRPRPVTFGATLAVTGGAVLLFALVDLMTRVESIDVTQTLRDGLRSLRLSGDVTVEQARDVLRYTIMVFAVLCVAAIVFGIFTLKRDRAARVALTSVLGTVGVVALFGGPATWLITLYAAVSVAMLWSRSAREWFAGTYAPTSGSPPPTGSGGPDDPSPRPPAPPPPGWHGPPYGPPPGWQPPPLGPPPGWIPPPGWPHLPPPPPGWRPPPGTPTPEAKPPTDDAPADDKPSPDESS